MDHAADKLCCPKCRAYPLVQNSDHLVCKECGETYGVIGGIPRLILKIPDDTAQIQEVFDFEHRLYQDSYYTRFSPRLVEQFLEDCQLPREYFSGKDVLDAGCGSGRWTYALAELNSRVVAVDLTDGGVAVTQAELGDRDNVEVYQASIEELPFRDESFDFVMSWGVLHHTRDTQEAFKQLVPLVKTQGILYVMVYKKDNFLRAFFTNVLRKILRSLPNRKRYDFCRFLVFRHKIPYLLISRLVIVSYYNPSTSRIDPKTMQFGLYDAYSPRYNFRHTPQEVMTWFMDAGFSDVHVIPKTYGAVKIQGVKSGKR